MNYLVSRPRNHPLGAAQPTEEEMKWLMFEDEATKKEERRRWLIPAAIIGGGVLFLWAISK